MFTTIGALYLLIGIVNFLVFVLRGFGGWVEFAAYAKHGMPRNSNKWPYVIALLFIVLWLPGLLLSHKR